MARNDFRTQMLGYQARLKEAAEKNDQSAFDAVMREAKMCQTMFDAEMSLTKAMEQKVSMAKRSKLFQEAVKAAKQGGQTEFALQRSVTSGILHEGDLNNMETAGIPLTIEDLQDPLEMGLIYNTVGLQIATGVRGNIEWPFLDTVAECTVNGELDEVGDTDLDYSKLTTTQNRLSVSILVTNEALANSSFDLQTSVITQINKALGRTLNKAVIGQTSVGGTLAGPFVSGSGASEVTFAGSLPTFEELLSMEGAVADAAVDMSRFCYIMNAVTKSQLKAVPKSSSCPSFVVEDDQTCGYPIFTTDSNLVPTGTVLAGNFSYAALNQHGDSIFIIDPYTAAKKNAVVLTLNANWSLTVLRPQAFCIGTATA
ncbi:MAG: phage major capsid protein [Prevotellaceae bacterium]|nr:phage major capsid protein [Prevotellaceae bacterium]